MRAGFLVIISAPSGTGKSTVCRKLLSQDRSFKYSVSYTTRGPRPGEIPGRHYHFVSVPEFRRRIRQGEFLEWALVHGNYYGTPRRYIEEQLAAGHVVLLDVDVQGADSIRRRRIDSATIFLLPPSWGSLKQRLRHRRDSWASIARRLANAREELKHAKDYDYWVVNDNLATAVRQVSAIISAERLRSRRRAAPGAALSAWISDHSTASRTGARH